MWKKLSNRNLMIDQDVEYVNYVGRIITNRTLNPGFP
jgi:hypothetical protein